MKNFDPFTIGKQIIEGLRNDGRWEMNDVKIVRWPKPGAPDFRVYIGDKTVSESRDMWREADTALLYANPHFRESHPEHYEHLE